MANDAKRVDARSKLVIAIEQLRQRWDAAAADPRARASLWRQHPTLVGAMRDVLDAAPADVEAEQARTVGMLQGQGKLPIKMWMALAFVSPDAAETLEHVQNEGALPADDIIAHVSDYEADGPAIRAFIAQHQSRELGRSVLVVAIREAY
jgi:hypothetical protein